MDILCIHNLKTGDFNPLPSDTTFDVASSRLSYCRDGTKLKRERENEMRWMTVNGGKPPRVFRTDYFQIALSPLSRSLEQATFDDKTEHRWRFPDLLQSRCFVRHITPFPQNNSFLGDWFSHERRN